ncbi:MAG: diaminopimelate epimerase, partial [Methanomassiliicoccaceae archaeon]|nr:diaminopimelate epimerase [Methanomassiliicoccaceae archaeon]
MMSFWKYHGIGNDFILIDGIGTGKGPDVDVDPERCRLWCDRNFGIGADGVVFLLPGEGADVAMRVINADGSEAEMCGNGIRCLAKHAYDHGYVGGDEDFTVATPAGVKAVSVSFNDGEVTSARVDMGAPVLEGRSIPIDHDGRFIDRPLEVGGIEVKGSAVSMGNPHFVTFADISDDDAARLGPA